MSRCRSLVGLVLAMLVAGGCSSRPGVSQSSPPPVVTIASPAEGSYLHGSVDVTATAQGTVRIKAFTFTAPAALAGTVATLDPNNKSAQLATTLDLSTYPDGALKISVTAEDDAGMKTTKDVTINVAAKAPTISIGSPFAGATVKGAALAVTATASAQTGASITKLELLDPPVGMGPNTSAAAAFFAATWDSTKAPEGPVTLHFRATDSTGLVGDASATVTVDNVPLGKVDAFVFAGAPVPNATVEVWALSNATGAVDTTAGVNGLLGSAGPTDAGGHVLVTLTAENYAGPVQVVAKPAAGSTLQYVDPSDPGSGFVQITSGVTLTSIVPDYVTGQNVTAPITLTTTLADVEVLAYAAGQHRLHMSPSTIAAASGYANGLFTQHVQSSTPRWNLRSTVPVDLTAGATTLTDRAYAAFMDIALNQLAKDLGNEIYVTGVITAPFLVAKFSEDLAADGQLDGKGPGGTVITTQTGSPPYTFDENTLRVRLANALDTWIQSPRNQSTLNRSTLAGANIYKQISEDTSELFGPGAPISFDNAAPTVTTVITYGPSNQPPFAGSYVSGTMKLVVTATDPSRVKSVSVKLGDQLLDSSATVVTSADGLTSTYSVSVNTAALADLSYMLNVTVVDQKNNSGTTTVATVTTDNTAPTVAQAQPVASTYYGANVGFDATASDGAGSGVASLAVNGYTGLVDGDASAAHFMGTWTIPVGASDGPAAGNWTTCDNVGNCASPALTVQVDRTAPSVALSGTPPTYLNTSEVTLTVTASDAGAGVAAVYAQAPGDYRRAGVLASGVWTIPGIKLQAGRNFVAVWAEDKATPVNGSSGSGISVQVIVDGSAPTGDLLASGSYNDERGLRVATDAGGLAMTPPVYSFTPATATKTPIALNGDIYKASTRLSWTTAPTAAVLEGANPENIPFIQINVPCDPTSQSPITTAQYQVAVTCPGCSFEPTPWADLLVSSVNAGGSGKNVYDLPLAGNNVPALLTALPASAQVSVVVRLSDAAGNQGTAGPWTFNFHVVGAPVGFAEDSGYATAGDPRSTYPYTSRMSGYSVLFDAGTTVFLPDNQVRLIRYLVTNPASTPVLVDVSALTGAQWGMVEEWAGTSSALPTKVYSQCTTPMTPAPCSNTQIIYTPAGSTTTQCGTQPPHNVLPVTETPTAASGTNYFTKAYVRSGGGDVSPATSPAAGRYVVPAAAGGEPGTLAVYLGRPIGASRTYASGTYNATAQRFVAGVEDAWKLTSSVAKCGGVGGVGYETTWTGTAWARALQSGTENVSFTLAPVTYGAVGSAVTGGATALPAITVTGRAISH